VHTDARAGESAKAINSLAYTLGRDIVFAPGRYAPNTTEGLSLIAHELAHVVQQGSGAGAPPWGRAVHLSEDKQAESEATRIGAAVLDSQQQNHPILPADTGAEHFRFRGQSNGSIVQKRGRAGPNMIQRAVAGDIEKLTEEPKAKPEPAPVDCTKEITPAYDCFKLIGDMIKIAADMRDNDNWIEKYDKGETPWDTDAYAARLRYKAELQKKYNDKERIRAACCPDKQVPPEAPVYEPSGAPEPGKGGPSKDNI